MSVADRLNKLSTDITNAYTSIENKGGTIPANKNTNNLPTAINSIEVIEQATAEGESLNLTNTKAMPYKDYKVKGKSEQSGEPSPSNPSEIHSVADDVNLFDVSNYTITYGGAIGFDVSNFEIGKQYTFSSNLPITDFKISNYSSGYNSVNNYVYNGFTNFTFTMARNSNIPSSETQHLFIALNLTNFITDINDITNYNIKVQKGSTPTSYSPYNQGTVTTKQSGKNKFDYKQITPGTSRTIENGGFVINDTSFQNGNIIAKLKTLCPDLKVGDKFKFNWDTNATRNNSDVTYIYLSSYANTIIKDTLYTCTQTMLDSDVYFYGQQGEYYKDIIFYLDGQTSDYEPYFSKDYTIQTEPLRSLPNGVKDTMELQDMQNHTRIGRQTGTLTETTTITLSDAKTNGAYMCNIKPSGTLTGKTIELEAGDYEIIYELAEEIIEPLTQNQATTMLDIIKTGSYDGTTNIYTNEDVKPTIGVGYYKKS